MLSFNVCRLVHDLYMLAKERLYYFAISRVNVRNNTVITIANRTGIGTGLNYCHIRQSAIQKYPEVTEGLQNPRFLSW